MTVLAKAQFIHATKPGHRVFAYVIGGKAYFCRERNPFKCEMEAAKYFDIQRNPYITNESLVLFNDGEQIAVSTENEPVRFLLISGELLGEPVAW